VTRTTYVMPAFVLGWTKAWNNTVATDSIFSDVPDLFRATVMHETEGREHEQFNRTIAQLFGEVVTKVKAFPTTESGKGWIILDKHTKRMLHRDVKNEYDVDALCKKHGYVR